MTADITCGPSEVGLMIGTKKTGGSSSPHEKAGLILA